MVEIQAREKGKNKMDSQANLAPRMTREKLREASLAIHSQGWGELSPDEQGQVRELKQKAAEYIAQGLQVDINDRKKIMDKYGEKIYKAVFLDPTTEAGNVKYNAPLAALRGARQGASMSFSEEFDAARAAKAKGLSGLWDVVTGPDKLADLPGKVADAYQQERATGREINANAQVLNPTAYGASEVGGGLVSGIATLPVGGPFLKGAQVGAKAAAPTLGRLAISGAKQGAAYGAATGLGLSDADTVAGAATDTGVGAAAGAGLGAALPVGVAGAKKLLGGLGSLAAGAARKGTAAVLLPPGGEEALKTAWKNPAAVRGYMDKPGALTDIAESVTAKLDAFQKENVSGASGKAFLMLGQTDAMVPKATVNDLIDTTAAKVLKGSYSDDRDTVLGLLGRYKRRIGGDNAALEKTAGQAEGAVAQGGTDFNPAILDMQNAGEKIKMLRDSGDLIAERDALREAVKNNPAARFAQYANKNGDLPEVLGEGKNKFARLGDDAANEAGFADSETARAAKAGWQADKARLAAVESALQDKNVVAAQVKGLTTKGAAPAAEVQSPDLPIENVKTLVMDLDEITDAPEQFGVKGRLINDLRGLRNQLDTEILKNGELNPQAGEYKILMEKLAQDTEISKDVRGAFRTPDTLAAGLKRIGQGQDSTRLRALQDFDQRVAGGDIEKARQAAAGRVFSSPDVRGSRRTTPFTIAGSALGSAAGGYIAGPTGAAIGSVIGGGVGALTGAVVDKYGGRGAMVGLEAAKSIAKVIDAGGQTFAPFANTLREAATRGPAALAATHYLLYQRIPEYKKEFDQTSTGLKK